MSAHEHSWDAEVPCVEVGPDVCLTPMRGHPARREGHGPDFHGWVRDGRWVPA